ncbi:MAG: DNA internalization-related competence protein ComEC/Rec2, partial [Deltaproteobacteria bacterium]|nr:DNA internalization-related competence protein ComEC/Rec2 [Deltaproteobacteria bacterium]
MNSRLSWACAVCVAGVWLLGALTGPKVVHDAALEAWLSEEGQALRGREPVWLEGTVREVEQLPGAERLVLELERREVRPGAEGAAPPRGVKARLVREAKLDAGGAWRAGTGEALHRGDRVRLLAHLAIPQRSLNPGGRDLADELAYRGISLTGRADALGLTILARGPAWWRWLDEQRARFAQECARLCSTRERAAIVAALGVGDRSLLEPEIADELSATGLIHLLTSAGLRLGLLALLLRTGVRAVLLRLPRAISSRASLLSAAAVLPALLFDTLLVGAPLAAVRACVAQALRLGGALAGRRAEPGTSFWLSLALLTAWAPSCVRDPGVQLSTLGVLGVLLLAPRLRALWPERRPAPVWARAPILQRGLARVSAALLHGACATLAAALATLPLALRVFGQVPASAILAQLAALGPGLLAQPFALGAALLVRSSGRSGEPPLLELVPLSLADALAGVVERLTAWGARLPFATLTHAPPAATWLVAWLGVVASLFMLAGLRQRRPALRLWALTPIACAGLALGPMSAWHGREASLTVTFFAVGQGDSALVRMPDGFTILVDGGGPLMQRPPSPREAGQGSGALPAGRRTDPGAREVLPALGALGVDALDLVVLTHPHPDHGGGLPAILRALPVRELWTTGEPGPDGLGAALRALAAARGIPTTAPRRGLVLEHGGARLEVLAPGAWDPARSTNDNSIVLRVARGDEAILLAGDAEAAEELTLLEDARAQGRSLRAGVLKAGHHGSRTSTTDAFLRAVAPAHAILSLGRDNPFGFPHREVLERLHDAGVR